jgi:hypothetical protein
MGAADELVHMRGPGRKGLDERAQVGHGEAGLAILSKPDHLGRAFHCSVERCSEGFRRWEDPCCVHDAADDGEEPLERNSVLF